MGVLGLDLGLELLFILYPLDVFGCLAFFCFVFSVWVWGVRCSCERYVFVCCFLFVVV